MIGRRYPGCRIGAAPENVTSGNGDNHKSQAAAQHLQSPPRAAPGPVSRHGHHLSHMREFGAAACGHSAGLDALLRRRIGDPAEVLIKHLPEHLSFRIGMQEQRHG